MAERLLSGRPQATLVDSAGRFSTIVAAARTCYSSNLIFPKEVVGWSGSESLAKSTFKAGHHTLLEHCYLEFALEGVSRQLIWSFLHTFPYYNSSQQSQRYVEMNEAGCVTPPLEGRALRVYKDCLMLQFEAYRTLIKLLTPKAEEAYSKRFPRFEKSQVQKKAQEVARYVLPVATKANLYYTINLLTLLRLRRLSARPDVSLEQRVLTKEMRRVVLEKHPEFRIFFEKPIPKDKILERINLSKDLELKEFREEFDSFLEEGSSKLVSYTKDGEELLAQTVREVLGLAATGVEDEEAIEMVLSPSKNSYQGETLNLSSVSKLMRVLDHITYSFKKRISHTCDSQNQRHRTISGSRPCLAATFSRDPDYVIPALVEEDEASASFYKETMERIWGKINKLLELGVSREFASYLLPNAVAIRFTETGSLRDLLHKFRMRLCFNAQREIWEVSTREVEEIRRVHPQIGKWLGPPCLQRKLADRQPVCPEGDRFCGVNVWQKEMNGWQRLI